MDQEQSMIDPPSTAVPYNPGLLTADTQTSPSGQAPGWLLRSVRGIEASSALDRPVAGFARLSGALVRSQRVESVLRGAPAGHALHPLLTDFPLGAFMSATLLDLCGGRSSRRAATGLVGFGLAMAVPTAATGVAEWRSAGHVARRVGVVHATVNGLATTLYAASFVARLRKHHGRGVGLAVAGGTAAWVGGYLGGHLSLVRKIGTADASFGPVVTVPTP